jgi:RND family efflux transporter MFP subunit
MAISSLADTEKSTDALSRLQIRRADSNPKGSWPKRLLTWTVIPAAVLAALVGGVVLANKYGWLSDQLAMPAVLQSRTEVRLASVTVETGRSGDATVVATGYLESQRQAKIGAKAPGRIELVNVEEGSSVKKGEVLAILEHADLDASLAAIEASLARAKSALAEQEVVIEHAKREFYRAERLWKSMSIAESAYDEARFKYDEAVARRTSLIAEIALAEARVRESQQMKENMFIRAPFDGTVISKDAEVGESILPGGMGEASGRGSAVTVADLDHLDVDSDVKEDFISRVFVGQPTEVAVDAVPDFRYQGRVRKIIPMGDRARATIKVKVEIVNVDDRLFPEMSATVYFLPTATAATEPQKRRVFCDSAAIQKDSQGMFVWTVDDQDRVHRNAVTTGPVRDGRTEIVSGLSGEERVIIAPPDIKPGQLVQIAS